MGLFWEWAMLAQISLGFLSCGAPLVAALPSPAAVLADGKKAFDYWAAKTPVENCGWTGATFLLGSIEYYKATVNSGVDDAAALDYATNWAAAHDYKICAPASQRAQRHNADNQLCGATYVELFRLSGGRNATMLADTAAVIGAEIAEGPASDGLWSWVDALHMAMQTFARMGNTTGDLRYFEKQFANFNASVLAKADPRGRTYQFWNTRDHLFYRDDRYLGTQIYWSRGNGWAISALAAALQWGAGVDPHFELYLGIFKQHAAKLKSLQYPDGAWRSSLLNVTAMGGACSWRHGKGVPCKPVAETTGTASFCYALAWGINTGILPSDEYLPAVMKAWAWLSATALHGDGSVGNCQPMGAAPANNFGSNSTNNFCVGLFLMASSQVSRLSPAATAAAVVRQQ